MKKLILIALTLVATSSAFAQFHLGAKAGLNYNTIKAQEQEFDESGVLGYQLGLWGRFGKGLYLQPEAYIGSKGSTFNVQVGNTTTQEKQKFTTLDVPLLLGTRIGGDKINFRLMAGPSFQFLLDDNSSAFSQATNPDFYKAKDFITNGQLGAGIDLGNLSVDLRYETSLQDINQGNTQKQNLLHLSVGFKLF